jgi:putative ABC transport system ATP-binding protein
MKGMANDPKSEGASPVIRLEGISKTYQRNGTAVRALREVNLVIHPGEFAAIMGRSGSGKSTMLHILGLIDAEYEGRYWFDGDLVSGRSADQLASLRNRAIGFVFQSFHLLPQLSILENVTLPALYAGDRTARQCREAAGARLEEMGLGARIHHRPAELSIGERQRAGIARALVNGPRVVLADEPTGALDSKTTEEILDIFHRLHRNGATLVLVTHDHDVGAAAERIIRIRDGQTHDGAV